MQADGQEVKNDETNLPNCTLPGSPLPGRPLPGELKLDTPVYLRSGHGRTIQLYYRHRPLVIIIFFAISFQ